MLDALKNWQLVREAGGALDRPAAASFTHVSPAAAAVAGAVDDVTGELYRVAPTWWAPSPAPICGPATPTRSPPTATSPLSRTQIDVELAELLTRVACDGLVAPG
jgi:phosphoribosylaminoimidazolecarboxamide formyltransferase/IMP cyclohydrolase